MTGKRKRTHQKKGFEEQRSKKARLDTLASGGNDVIRSNLLVHYYQHVQTLSEYLLQRLGRDSGFNRRLQNLAEEDEVLFLLKTTLVGYDQSLNSDDTRAVRVRDFQDFTQSCTQAVNASRRTSGGLSSTLGDGSAALSDLVDFAIWRTFVRTYRGFQRPPHVLCNGFTRAEVTHSMGGAMVPSEDIHGLNARSVNAQVDRIKGDDWARLLQMLGKDGDYVLLDLLLECGIFVPLSINAENYLQLSGINLSELPLLDPACHAPLKERAKSKLQIGAQKASTTRRPSDISFVRSRMFYSRPALNAKGEVHFGLRHIHVLNRFPDPTDKDHTVHIMKYIFPRQFGLHNVFTSQVNKLESSHPFKDYTLREEEIASDLKQYSTSLPKRLRGSCFELVKKLQRLNKRCAYKELLKHYCPVEQIDRPPKRGKRRSTGSLASSSQRNLLSTSLSSQSNRSSNLVDLATPMSSVSAFVRAVIGRLIPRGFLGTGQYGSSNWDQLCRSINQFIGCKRFENISLDVTSHSIKTSTIGWLQPPNVDPNAKIARSDHLKRAELLHEFLYYIFDSIVIPLVRANFHVTESNDHRYRLFYFRHDVWRLVTQPAITRIKSLTYQEIQQDQAIKILGKRTLGFSNLRLLPKKATARPITNLRRRPMTKRNGRLFLGMSINSAMKHVLSMLNYEKQHQAELLGSAIFSINELYPRLITFRRELVERDLSKSPLFFVKVDVQSCFDTIPQKALLELVEEICQQNSFTIKHHAQIKAVSPSMDNALGKRSNARPVKKFQSAAHATMSSQTAAFPELVDKQYAVGKKGLVFVEGSIQSQVYTEDLLDLLDDHINRNIVRIGKKYYRQKNGIPQGSIVSSLLCSFFYGDFERKKLSFLHKSPSSSKNMHSILIRLIDDFLLVTTCQEQAERFLQVMLSGDPEYGIAVKAEKTLTNFTSDVHSSSPLVSILDAKAEFPWCGQFIDTQTLSLSRDRSKTSGIDKDAVALQNISRVNASQSDEKGQGRKRRQRRQGMPDLADSTTTDARRAGAAFYRKTLHAVRLNVRDMYTDTGVSSVERVKAELLTGLTEVAEKAARYMSRLKGFVRRRTPKSGSNSTSNLKLKAYDGSNRVIKDSVLQKTIEDVAKLITVLTREEKRDGSEKKDAENESKGRQQRGGGGDEKEDGQGHHQYECRVSRRDIERLTIRAFSNVLQRQQTGFRDTLAWLKSWDERT